MASIAEDETAKAKILAKDVHDIVPGADEFADVLTDELNKVQIQDDSVGIINGFMREAINMAELALRTDETPVGCVFVHEGKIIARGMNATNRSLNGTRHAEFIAISEILNPRPELGKEPLPASVLRETDVYVTVEPCIMCASLLRQYNIRKVYYGASNDKFGGTGGVLWIHSDPDIGKEPGYEASGGWLREDAILALRKFYVQENEKAPEPRNKKERKLKTEIQPFQKPTPATSKTRPRNPRQDSNKLNLFSNGQMPKSTTPHITTPSG